MVTGGDEHAVRSIVGAFRAEGVSFLTPYGDDADEENRLETNTLVDISHEALIRCWDSLADERDGWLQREFKDGLNWRSLVVQAESFKDNPERVLSPARTEEVETWIQGLPSRRWCARLRRWLERGHVVGRGE